MHLFVIHSAGLFEGAEVCRRSPGEAGHVSNCCFPSIGGQLNEFSSGDLCLFAVVLVLASNAGSYADVAKITLGFYLLKVGCPAACEQCLYSYPRRVWEVKRERDSGRLAYSLF